VEFVRLLQRSGRQRLGLAGASCSRLGYRKENERGESCRGIIDVAGRLHRRAERRPRAASGRGR
jgi:hypothetical protein